MTKGEGHGKIIIFGEHFVVYGAPSIAAAISRTCEVEVRRAEENRIVTDRKVSPELSGRAISNVLSAMGITDRYEVFMGGDLPTDGGLGSSAAFCVGMVKAFAEDNGIPLTPEDINRYAYEGEKAFHGNPSGVDNYIATHRGVIEFTRGESPLESRFVKLELVRPLDFVISMTGKNSPTPKMIEAVRKFKEADAGRFQQLMDEYHNIAADGRKFVEKGKLGEIGNRMNANQSLLSELGVSDERNDAIVELALKEGALGAKLTGGGGGGCCIALAKDREHAERIAASLNGKGIRSFTAAVSG